MTGESDRSSSGSAAMALLANAKLKATALPMPSPAARQIFGTPSCPFFFRSRAFVVDSCRPP
jgi:hypothetical protein